MAAPIVVTGAAGRVGGIGRTVTELLLKHGKAVRAMVRTEDERAKALRQMGAEVVVGDLLDLMIRSQAFRLIQARAVERHDLGGRDNATFDRGTAGNIRPTKKASL